jgi:hypothetical protein
MAVTMDTKTEVTYEAELGKAVLCEETNTLYFPNAFSATASPEKVRELAAMLHDIAVKMAEVSRP